MLKVLLKTNDIHYITIKPILNVDNTNNTNTIIKNVPCFSKILAMRITFINSIRRMSYDYYIKQRFSMCEIRLNQLLHKNPKLIYSLDRFTIYPFFQKNAYIPAEEKNLVKMQLFKYDY